MLKYVTAHADFARAVAMRAERSTVFAGSCEDGRGYDARLARRNSDGSPDAAFSTNGSVITPISTDGHDKAVAVAVSHSDGDIAFVGACGATSNRDLCTVGYLDGACGTRICSLDTDGAGKHLPRDATRHDARALNGPDVRWAAPAQALGRSKHAIVAICNHGSTKHALGIHPTWLSLSCAR